MSWIHLINKKICNIIIADPPSPLDEHIHCTDNVQTSGTTSSGDEGIQLIYIITPPAVGEAEF